jgi:hypothetical protein
MRGAATCFGFSQPSSGNYCVYFAKVVIINNQLKYVVYRISSVWWLYIYPGVCVVCVCVCGVCVWWCVCGMCGVCGVCVVCVCVCVCGVCVVCVWCVCVVCVWCVCGVVVCGVCVCVCVCERDVHWVLLQKTDLPSVYLRRICPANRSVRHKHSLLLK